MDSVRSFVPKRGGDTDGHVSELWTAEDAGEPMRSVEAVRAVAGGLDGDRYQRGTGYYAPFDVCEVTLVAGEALDAIRREAGIDLSGGDHRRNVVTRGVDLSELLDAQFRVGDALLEGTRPRPPCRHVENVAGLDGLMEALRGRGGICARVVEPGTAGVGDAVTHVEDTGFDGEKLATAIEKRHRDDTE